MAWSARTFQTEYGDDPERPGGRILVANAREKVVAFLNENEMNIGPENSYITAWGTYDSGFKKEEITVFYYED